jgi:tRNA(Ile)-lysidine synthase
MASSRKLAPEQLALSDCLKPWPNNTQVWIGFSGGLDSTVLLHAAHVLLGSRVRAIHLNHGLQVAAADFQRHCEHLCQLWQVPLVVLQNDQVKPAGESLEAFARRERYQRFAHHITSAQSGQPAVLLTAHHQNDQAETVLLALARGADLAGLAGIAPSTTLFGLPVLRPLLGIAQAQLQAYAKAHALTWIEDPSNQHLSLQRNWVRHQVMPLLQRQWPQFVGQAARSAKRLQAHLPHSQADAIDLSRSKLLDLPATKQAELVRAWLNGQGLLMPSQAKLNEIIKQLTADGAYASVAHQGHIIARYRNQIFLQAQTAPQSFEPVQFVLEGIDAKQTPSVGFNVNGQQVRVLPPRQALNLSQWQVGPAAMRTKFQPADKTCHREIRLWCQQLGIGTPKRKAMWALHHAFTTEAVYVHGLGLAAWAKQAGWQVIIKGCSNSAHLV